MRLLSALSGLLMGSFLNWAAGQLPCFSSSDVASSSISASRPKLALWDLLSSAVRQRSWPHLSRPSWIEVVVELLSALLFTYLWGRFGPSWKLLVIALVGSFLLLITIIDLRYRLVPNVLTYPAAAATLLLNLVIPGQSPLIALLGGAVGLATFLLVALLKPGDIGGGDVKLAALIGLMLGFPLVLWALLLGATAGGITAILLLLIRRWEPKSHIPYAPFLCLGAMCCLICPIPLPALAL
jgi:prepilin signal peptidase PulO-like enzyme (type II secretory pathway)